MGQKKTKLLLNHHPQIDCGEISIAIKSSSSSQSIIYAKNLSESKLHHESVISNDSGCFTDNHNESSIFSLDSKQKSNTHTNKLNRNASISEQKSYLLSEQLDRILTKCLLKAHTKKNESISQKPKLNTSVKTLPSNSNRKSQNNFYSIYQNDTSRKFKVQGTKSLKKISENLFGIGRRTLSSVRSAGNKCTFLSDTQTCTAHIEQNLLNFKTARMDERVCNLIAAKLLSEGIELANFPYTDEIGFCRIPRSLIKRYAGELKRDLNVVARCMESERLKQLEKSGKLGIPNDFLAITSCRCHAINKENRSWQICRCDLNTTNLVEFFYKLGLPMYAESSARNKIDIIRLLNMNKSELERHLEVTNQHHLNTISDALDYAKIFMQF